MGSNHKCHRIICIFGIENNSEKHKSKCSLTEEEKNYISNYILQLILTNLAQNAQVIEEYVGLLFQQKQ